MKTFLVHVCIDDHTIFEMKEIDYHDKDIIDDSVKAFVNSAIKITSSYNVYTKIFYDPVIKIKDNTIVIKDKKQS